MNRLARVHKSVNLEPLHIYNVRSQFMYFFILQVNPIPAGGIINLHSIWVTKNLGD